MAAEKAPSFRASSLARGSFIKSRIYVWFLFKASIILQAFPFACQHQAELRASAGTGAAA